VHIHHLIRKRLKFSFGFPAVRHLRTILSLILTNSEVRKLLTDFSVIGRDLLAKGASKAAEHLRPNEEELARVNEAAPQDEFVSKGGRKIGPRETPVLEAKVPGTGATVEQHPRADDAKVTTDSGKEKSGKQVVDEGRDALEDAQNRARETKGDMQEKAHQAKGTAQEQADQARRQGCVISFFIKAFAHPTASQGTWKVSGLTLHMSRKRSKGSKTVFADTQYVLHLF